jgi:RNA polymerase sigma-70 factor (ECF subfamily)
VLNSLSQRFKVRQVDLMDASITIRLAGFTIPDQQCPDVEREIAYPDVAEGLSDEKLMAQICDGSREALAILFRRYARLVRTVAMRILRDDSEADDLLQDVFLFVHRHCSIFDSSKAGLRSWIVQMTYHRAIDRRFYLNSRHFYNRLDLDGIVELSDPRSQGREDCSILINRVGTATIQGFLGLLSVDQRNTLNLHFFEGYTFGEIAVKLDQSLGNIRNHYYRGLDKLRKQMFPGEVHGARKARREQHSDYGRK